MTNTDVKRGSFEFFAKWCRTNTGKSLCDSGDYYGRQYDKPVAEQKTPAYGLQADCGWVDASTVSAEQIERQGLEVKSCEDYSRREKRMVDKVFLSYPKDQLESGLTYKPGDVMVATTIISTAHFLSTMLEADDVANKLQRAWEIFQNHHCNGYQGGGDDLERFLKRVSAISKTDIKLSQRGDNTYNSDNDFDQDFVFYLIDVDGGYHRSGGETYVAMAPHTGCDVRSGYPSLQFFKVDDLSYFLTWQVDFNTEEGDVQFCSIYDFTEGGYGNKYQTRFVMGENNEPVAQTLLDGEWVTTWPYSPADGY